MTWGTLPQIAAITPKYLQMLLLNAASGNYTQQWELFDLMQDTWPVLGSTIQELTYGVERKKLIFEPYREEDEQPTPSAVEKSQLCSKAICEMSPAPANDENDSESMVRDIMNAWFVGLSVQEIMWTNESGDWMPKFTQWTHPKYLGFSEEGNLGLRVKNPGGQVWAQFPDNKFLVAIHKSKAGNPASGALLRPLAWWWCAANFSADWMLNLAQLFGLPWRIAKYDPNASADVQNQIDTMLQNMGSATWGRFPIGTEFELVQPHTTGSDHSPQGEMLDRADRYARDLILGQTMAGGSGTTGKGGGQAFGTVEHEVKEDRIDAAGKFVANVINQQLIKSILQLNYGNTDEAPKVRFLNDEEGDYNEAQRDKVLSDMGVPIGVRFAQKKYGIPAPAEDEELLSKPEPTSQFGSAGGDFFDAENPEEEKAPNEEQEPAKAGDLPGHEFHGNQYEKYTTGRTQLERHTEQSVKDRDALLVGEWEKTPSNTFMFNRGKLPEVGSRVSFMFKSRGSNSRSRINGVVTERFQKGFHVKMDDIPGQRGSPTVMVRQEELIGIGQEFKKIHHPDISAGLESLLEIEDDAEFMEALKAAASQMSILPSEENARRLERNRGSQQGHPFYGNQYVKLGETVDTPHGRGMVVANTHDGAFVSVKGTIRKVKHADIKRIKHAKGNKGS